MDHAQTKGSKEDNPRWSTPPSWST